MTNEGDTVSKETTGEFYAPESVGFELKGWDVRHPRNSWADPKIKHTRGVQQLLTVIDHAGDDGLLMGAEPNLGKCLARRMQDDLKIPMGEQSRWRTIGRTARTLSERGFITIKASSRDNESLGGERAGTAWWLTLEPLGRKQLVAHESQNLLKPDRLRSWTFTTESTNDAACKAHEVRPSGYGTATATYQGLSSWPDEQVSMTIQRAPSDTEQIITMRLGTAINSDGDLSDYYRRWLQGKKPEQDLVDGEAVLMAAFISESRMTPDPKKVDEVTAALRFLSEADLVATRRWLFDLGGQELQETMTDRMMTDTRGIAPWQWVSATLDAMFDTVWKGTAHGPHRRWALRQIRRLAVTAIQSSLDLDHDLIVFASTGAEMAAKTRDRQGSED